MKGPDSTTPDGSHQNLPLWRKHFPVDTEEDAAHTRRQFVGGLAVAGGAVVCGQAALHGVVDDSADETGFQTHGPLVLEKTFSDLRDGEAVLFHYPDPHSPCLLVRQADQIVAFSQKCTHLACPVIPDVDAGKFVCPCHKGAFDLQTGAAVSGPPRKPLPKVRIARSDDGTLTATGIQPG